MEKSWTRRPSDLCGSFRARAQARRDFEERDTHGARGQRVTRPGTVPLVGSAENGRWPYVWVPLFQIYFYGTGVRRSYVMRLFGYCAAL